ncbi:hypothetical protein TCAL_15137 [Tigriopus californicus]|uniref:Uncharacterized protein n=1 Tax=Tigriopus californicus TaxID=6832 RepID=A0A553NVR8_TIGCA|nr:hypothetical protein TCAL_15137 [Tigriopus californicus]
MNERTKERTLPSLMLLWLLLPRLFCSRKESSSSSSKPKAKRNLDLDHQYFSVFSWLVRSPPA